MATSSDLNLNLFIINTISKANYDLLSSAGQLQQNELYFISDAPIDANGAKIANVAEPELSSDAATKNYIDEQISSIDATKISYKLMQEESTQLQDRAINKLTMDGDLSVWFPPAHLGTARDFLLNLDYVSGQMTIADLIEKSGDDIVLIAGKKHLMTFTEIGTKNGLPHFYMRVLELD